MKFWRKCI